MILKKFCEVNFNINFPLTGIQMSKVKKLMSYLSGQKIIMGKSAIPKWNFHKILINKEGKVEDTFAFFYKSNSKNYLKKLKNYYINL